jgi:DNA polymerase
MDKAAGLTSLYNEYATAILLQEVAHGRRLVRGCGPLDSPLVVVGEAPGAQEEERGRPFVGPSGQLLQKLFAQAGLPWDLCYVMNVLPWRPPGNRTPYPYEIIASYQRVRDEIALIDPRAVVTAGATAWHGVTQNSYGHFSEHHGHRLIAPPDRSYGLVCVRHPAALLRAHGKDREQMEAETMRALSSLLAGADA